MVMKSDTGKVMLNKTVQACYTKYSKQDKKNDQRTDHLTKAMRGDEGQKQETIGDLQFHYICPIPEVW